LRIYVRFSKTRLKREKLRWSSYIKGNELQGEKPYNFNRVQVGTPIFLFDINIINATS